MKTASSVALAAMLTLTGCAGLNMNDAVQLASAVDSSMPAAAPGSTRATISGLLSVLGATNTTSTQALGGTAALLGLAQSRLTAGEYAQLASAVPGVQQITGSKAVTQMAALGLLNGQATSQSVLNSALANTRTEAGVDQAFSTLGMDTGMVEVFSPLLLQYFGTQGVSGGVLQSLSSAWGVQG
jgi:hypothetical protein